MWPFVLVCGVDVGVWKEEEEDGVVERLGVCVLLLLVLTLLLLMEEWLSIRSIILSSKINGRSSNVDGWGEERQT